MSEITIETSMLEQASRMHDEMRKLRPEDAGKDHLTFLQRPYARAEPEDAVRKASVWFTAYMPSIIGPQREGSMLKPLATLCDPGLWTCFADLGIRAVHTGPVMKAGGYRANGERYASIDGWFDPISLDIDPDLGCEEDYRRLKWMAEHSTSERGERLNAVVIGDIVPGHTGMGADFHLALRGERYYPGLYVLARVDQVLNRTPSEADRHYGLTDEEIAGLTADFPAGQENEISRLLTESEVRALVRANVIPGKPQRAMGAQAGLGWSITREIEGLPDINENTRRRWVYLHFFHPKQPTLNFLDPGYSAWRMVTGQLNYVMWDLRSTGVRLDANAFLGIEPLRKSSADPGATQTWSEAHPLSATVTNMLAWQARRLGGFSFEEKNLTVGDIAKSGEFGPDLAYDFITRPACEHALLTGKTNLLEFMFAEMKRFGVRPGMLVHALQNHDEVTYELVHLAGLESAKMHGDESAITFAESAASLRADMRRYALGRDGESDEELLKRAPNGFYNKESPNGLCTTMASLVAARLGARTLAEAAHRVDDIMRGHLLLAAFNALQPGVFALSGWDLVGALPIGEYELPQQLTDAGDTPKDWQDKDYRWVNRGAYRLMSSFADAQPAAASRYGVFELPEAPALYGPLDRQQPDPGSFFNQLRRLLQVRDQLELPVANFAGTLSVPGTSTLGFRLSAPYKGDRRGVLVLFNFAAPGAEPTPLLLRELLDEQWPTLRTQDNEVHLHQHCPDGTNGWTTWHLADPLHIAPWEWKLVRFTPIAKEL